MARITVVKTPEHALVPVADIPSADWLAVTNRVSGTQAHVASNWAPYGLERTGTADVAAGLQAFLDAAASLGLPAVLAPGLYPVATQITVPDGLTLIAHGATIRHDLPDVAGQDVAALVLDGVSNVTITGLAIDGNQAAYTGATEHRHCLHIHNSHHVTLDGCTFTDAKGDGIAIGNILAGVETTLASTHVVLRNVTCDGNARQGLSVWVVDGLAVSDSYFTTTSGLGPGAGVDIEPNADTDVCRNIAFTRCAFRGNDATAAFAAGGISLTLRAGATWEDQHGFTFTQCEVRETALGHGVAVINARDAAFIACDVSANAQHGYYVEGVDGLTIRGGHIRGNGTAGGGTGEGVYLTGTCRRVTIDADISRNRQNGILAQTGATVTHARIGGRIYGNGTILANSRMGVRFSAGTYTDWLVQGATVGEAGETWQNCALYFDGGVTATRVRIYDNDLSQHAGPVAVNTAPAGVTFRDNAGYP